MRKILYAINVLRSFPCWVIVCIVGVRDDVMADLQRYQIKSGGGYKLFNKIMLDSKVYHNLLYYRVYKKNPLLARVVGLFFHKKEDLEIFGEIAGGLIIYHGHGTVICCESMGKNCSVYSGVIIGRNHRIIDGHNKPRIGDNVSIYSNAVVAGGITIGNNVKIGAGAVVLKDIPDNAVVIGQSLTYKIVEGRHDE